ncbi:type III polyketide synthase [Curtobacterium sp. VKM Ac-2922]|uniref:type III polyketide synthase n=1 Tax=Curtobacterium sp. VKM Ac-2922 TaxID=2929475 RepID=UPI001FB26811|nr:type III polyketide synthase [Curtobacterium sp. VKM Ac-2922]MCJ1713143.1 type III polyketide synthase [Curtobacterium sp. VKM Ac-2922]
MSATIRAIGTAVPTTTLQQVAVRQLFAAQPGLGRLGRRVVPAAFDASHVEHRHTVLPELDPAAAPGPFRDADGLLHSPSTGMRNDRYRELAPPLFVASARDALERAAVDPASVTHLVTVSCTGFTQPGPDLAIVEELGLRRTVFRHHIGFMGCCAAFPALRSAAAFAESDPDAVVLVVCAELCTLHVRASDDPDQIVANSVFGDGAAAAVVTADGPGLRLDTFATTLVPEGASEMAWNIGDEGFEMVLSTAVPKLVGATVAQAVAPLLDGPAAAVPIWAVHPGGRAILDRTQDALALPDSAMASSRAVLRDHGNMSSATVLFVLRDAVDAGLTDGTPVVALAFGPGLTVESARLTAVGTNAASATADVIAEPELAGELR